MTVTDVLPVVLYILGSILLVVLIILGIKLIITMNKIEVVVDDINKKVKTLDGFFSMVDFTTDKLAMLSEKEMKLIMSKNKSGLLKFAAGIGLGVGLGMLFAPKKGEELRKDLKVKFDELLNKVKEIDVKEVADDFMDKIEELKKELEDLDKEKVLAIAKKKGEELKVKASDLVILAKEKGTTILYSTHILSEVSKICSRGGIIKDGKIIKEDTVENIEKNNFTYLTIESQDIEQIKKELELKVISQYSNTVKFMNNLSPKEVINKISKYNMSKLLIEEVSIEDLFIEYYK